MRRVIRRRIRRKENGLDLAVDLNADVAVNVGRSRPGQVADAGAPEDTRPAEDPARTDDSDQQGKEP
jgi:hypothetical protein